MVSVTDTTPMLPVGDIDAACGFMEDCLGYRIGARSDGHAYLHRGGGAVRFINAPPDADLDDPAWQSAVYVDVDDVDALYAERRDALDALPEGHFRAPFDTHYGQRELHVIHGPVLFQIGHRIRRADAAS